MRMEPDVATADRGPVSRIAHVVARVGLAMAGALCGLFVAAHLTRTNIEVLNSVGFIALMCLVGIAGFYLGIDVPPGARPDRETGGRADPVELFSASGTFLAAVAALVSVYVIVFDDAPQVIWTIVVGCGWLLGVALQIGAGAIARSRPFGMVAGRGRCRPTPGRDG